MLIRGDAHAADPLSWKPWRRVFWVSKLKPFLDVFLKLPPTLQDVWGMFFFRPASSAQLGLRFSLLATSTYLEFWRGLEASCVWCQEGNWGPKQAHDAHDAGSWAAAGRLKCAINPHKTLRIHAVGSVCGCEYQCC